MNVFNKLLPFAAVLSLAACVGGTNDGSNNSTSGGSASVSFGAALTGQFVDAPVNGLNYKVNGGDAKKTSGKGNFSCKVGDSVEFLLGNLSLGSSACGNIVTPDGLLNSDADTVLVLLQNLGGGSSASLLDVGYLASQNVKAAVPAVLGATLGQVNALLSAASKPALADLDDAKNTAREAHDEYMASNSKIPKDWYELNFTTDVITATLTSGRADWCDATIDFRFQANVDKNGVGYWNAFDTDDNTIGTGKFYSSSFYFAVSTEDGDESYISAGSVGISSQGLFSGSWVETTTETATEDASYVGTKCAYKFGPVQGEVSDYEEIPPTL